MKLLREKKGITQEQLAEKLNVKQSTISMWEHQKAMPTIMMVKKIAKVFGITEQEVIDNIINKEKE